ncbi:MAG: aldo/keto reductase [Nitrososphaerota archaeon]|jgi:predicted aldo/keto reductase-like oxidoreductase|nr:aldo/keto reductase [Nitrososphaerota archaeon]
MQYRYVPKNGDKLSALGFGCMRLPLKGEVVDEPRAIKQIRFAIDNGVNYVDTAMPYHMGESEKILGKALQDGYRAKVKVATKLTPFMLQKPEDMQKMLDTQLQKLQTDHIDYYLLHGLDELYWKKLQSFGVLNFLKKAQKEGKIVNQAFSFHGSLRSFKEIVQANDWVMCQIQYNYLDEQLQAGTEGLQYAATHRLAVVVMEPLRGGGLAQKLPKEAKRFFDDAPIKRSPAEWGLRWVWDHPEVTVLLSGMNDESQVAENLKTAETALPNTMAPNELELIKHVADAYLRLLKINCTGCQYCLPCTNNINIPRNFQAYNDLYLSGDLQQTRNMYTLFLKGELTGIRADAALCKKCLQCIERCPQHINIPEKLTKVATELDQTQTNPNKN